MDRFDDIWKNRFNEKQVPAEEWSLPDDAIWNNIAAGIEVKKKRRPWAFWLPYFGGVTLIISMLFFLSEYKASNSKSDFDFEKITNLNVVPQNSNDQQTVNVSTTENETSQDLFKISKTKNTYSKASHTNNESLLNKKKANKQSDNLNQTNNKQFNKPSITPKTTLQKSGTELILRSSTVGLDITPKQLSRVDKLKGNKSESEALNFVAVDKPLSRLILKELESKSGGLDLNINHVHVNDFNKNPWNIEMNSGVVFWQNRISDQYQSDLSPFDFNYTDDFGWVSSLQLDKKINNRLSISTSLAYERVVSQSGHNSSINYNKSNEEVTTHNNYELNLATPYGLSAANFLLFRNTEIAEEVVDLTVDFKSKHTIQNLSLPVQVNYAAIKNQRFNMGLSVGFGINYLLGIKNEIGLISTNHSAIEHVEGTNDSFLSPEINEWHFDLRSGISLEYSIRRNTRLGLNYNWIHGLNPIFDADQYTNRINRHQLTLGIRKYFF